MPIHEYRCTECGHEFEELVRTEKQKVACEKCGSRKLERKLSTFAAVADPTSSNTCAQGIACPQGSCCSSGACNITND